MEGERDQSTYFRPWTFDHWGPRCRPRLADHRGLRAPAGSGGLQRRQRGLHGPPGAAGVGRGATAPQRGLYAAGASPGAAPVARQCRGELLGLRGDELRGDLRLLVPMQRAGEPQQDARLLVRRAAARPGL